MSHTVGAHLPARKPNEFLMSDMSNHFGVTKGQACIGLSCFDAVPTCSYDEQ
jgi:hypothetical protein